MSGSMNRIIRENPHVRDGETQSWLSARSAGNWTDRPAIGVVRRPQQSRRRVENVTDSARSGEPSGRLRTV
jgi:hypothetical protein